MEGHPFQRAFGRIVNARADEVRALLLSFAYFFCLLATYYVLRPVRDAIGASDTRNLPVLFTAVFFTMLVAAPLYGVVVSKLGRRRFVPIVYLFFAANILLFWLGGRFGADPVIIDRVFFVWLSVFNLFAVSVFWSFMADLFSPEQAKRLFGFIAAGGSLGVLAGPAATLVLLGSEENPGLIQNRVDLLPVALILFLGAVGFASLLERYSTDVERPGENRQAVGGNPFSGFYTRFRSPYLAGIAFWVVLLSFAGTMLYFTQAELVENATADAEERTAIFARIELAIGLGTIAIQLLLTGRLMKGLGLGVVAGILPLVFVIGFLTLGVWPVLFVAAALQVVQRTANFAFSNVARETLFTAADREDRFKAKNVIDGVVFRGADMVFGWLFPAFIAVGLGLSGVAFLSAPIAAGWFVLALALGRAHKTRSAKADADQGDPA